MFRPDVEGLRAIAVLAVVLFHAGVPGVAGGYVGVDVFFVVSGFLITRQLVAEVTRTGRISLIRFYARRAKRLLPMACVVVLATLLASWAWQSPLAARQVAQDALWSSLFSMNINLAISGVDYFAGTELSPLQHFWSLAVEEQFYLAWPLLLAALAGSWWGRRLPRAVLVVAVLGLVIASFVACVRLTAVAQPIAYFMPWTRAWELGLGGLVALAAGSAVRMPATARFVLGALGTAATLTAVLVYDEDLLFPGAWALLPTAGTAAVLVAGMAGPIPAVERVLGSVVAQRVGRLSYGLYLWHWPVLVLGPEFLGYDPGLAGRLVLVMFAAWLSVASYVAFEDPLRLTPVFSVRPLRAVAFGLACVVVTVSSAVGVRAFLPSLTGVGDPVAAVDPDEASVIEAVRVAQGRSGLVANLRPGLAAAAADLPRPRTGDGVLCMAGLRGTELARSAEGSCVFGDTDATRTAVLVGDSHAYQWFPAMERWALADGWRLVNLTKSGCPLFDVELTSGTLKREYRECYEWRDKAMERIVAERPDLVVTSAAIMGDEGDDFTGDWEAGVTRTVDRLQATDATVVWLWDTPYPGTDIPTCLADHPDDVGACAPRREDALRDPRRREATARAATAAGAASIDPLAWFCGATCPPVIGDTLVYRDLSHISATWSHDLGPVLGARLEAVLAQGPPPPLS